MRVVFNRNNYKDKGELYFCHKCDEVFTWNKHSCWFGSYSQMEMQPDKIKYYCSDKCAKADNHNGFEKTKAGRQKNI